MQTCKLLGKDSVLLLRSVLIDYVSRAGAQFKNQRNITKPKSEKILIKLFGTFYFLTVGYSHFKVNKLTWLSLLKNRFQKRSCMYANL